VAWFAGPCCGEPYRVPAINYAGEPLRGASRDSSRIEAVLSWPVQRGIGGLLATPGEVAWRAAAWRVPAQIFGL
jgi:hypothetical protein